MRAFIALCRREMLQHRSVFFYAPLILIAVVTALIVAAFASGHYRFGAAATGVGFRVFDLVYAAVALLWWGYLFVALFFYFADAFNADRRNNQMLFWKSMPQTDFAMHMAKLVSAMTVLPAQVFIAYMLTGVVAAVASFIAPHFLPLLGTPDLTATAWSYLNTTEIAFCYAALAVLWYMPFLAWVGALSTIVGRWSIPLALMLPTVLSLFEGVVNFGSAPGGSYILTYLRQRMSFNIDFKNFETIVGTPLDPAVQIRILLAGMDWVALGTGIVFAVVVLYLASEYRRRRVLKG